MIACCVRFLCLLLLAALAPAAGRPCRRREGSAPCVAGHRLPRSATDHRLSTRTRVATAIFEGLYEFDYLAAPARVVPNTAAAMPEISDNGRTWTIRLKPGILFADAPAFKGKPRELIAQDYVYSITRRLDPKLKRGGDPALTDLLEGARPVIDAARKSGKLDYDAKIEGLAGDRSLYVASQADCGRLHGTGAPRACSACSRSRAKRSKRRATTS